MRKFGIPAVALVASVAFTAPAHAFLLDGFGNDQPSAVSDSDDGLVTTTNTSTITDTDFDDPARTLKAEMTNCGIGCDPTDKTADEPGDTIRASIATDGAGNTFYDHVQDSGVEGYTEVVWDSFEAITLQSPLRLGVDILTNDNGATLTIALTHSGGITEDSITFGGGVTGFQSVSLFSGTSSFTDITAASMRLDSTNALDLAIDSIETPLPGVLGLIGVGLLGMAFVGRRRGDD